MPATKRYKGNLKASGEYLATLRKEWQQSYNEGYTQTDVAQQVTASGYALNQQLLQRIEKGNAVPEIVVLVELLRTINGSLSDYIELLMSDNATARDGMHKAMKRFHQARYGIS